MANIKEIKNLEEYNEFINNSNSLNVTKLGAQWCGPCRILEQTLNNLTDEEVKGVLLAEINVDDEWFEDKAVELKIRGIPVIIAFKDGVEVDRIVGAAPKDILLAFINRNL